MNISGNFIYLTDDVRYTDKCDNGNRITLGAGEGIVLSLFNDDTKGIKNSLTGTQENNITQLGNETIKKLQMELLGGSSDKLTFGLFDYDYTGNMENIVVRQLEPSDLHDFLKNNIGSVDEKRRYLSIKNPGTGDEVVSFCITTNMNNELIPYSDSLITVRGNYADMEVGLQSVVKRQSPSWSLNVLDL